LSAVMAVNPVCVLHKIVCRSGRCGSVWWVLKYNNVNENSRSMEKVCFMEVCEVFAAGRLLFTFP